MQPKEYLNHIVLDPLPSSVLRLETVSGQLDIILPELSALQNLEQNQYHHENAFDHTLSVIDGVPGGLIPRLAALLHDIAKPLTYSKDHTGIHFYDHETVGAAMAFIILTRFEYDAHIRDSVCNIVQNHMRLKTAGLDGSRISNKALRKFRTAIGSDLEHALLVMDADNKAHAPEFAMEYQIEGIRKRLDSLVDVVPKSTLPITGNDVMELLNIPAGPQVGDYLKIVSCYPEMSREDALTIVRYAHEKPLE